MQIRDVMTRDVELVHPETPIREAAKRMREIHSGFLPVSIGDRLVGTITDRDIAMRSTAEGQDPNAARVAEAMSSGIVYCFEDQGIREAAALMSEKQIRRLPVLNRGKRLVGVVSIGDVAERSGDGRLVGEAIEHISEHGAEPRNLEGGRKWNASSSPTPSHAAPSSGRSNGLGRWARTGWRRPLASARLSGSNGLATVEHSIEAHPFAATVGAWGAGVLVGALVGSQLRLQQPSVQH
jgi:CBS domain-containing protein